MHVGTKQKKRSHKKIAGRSLSDLGGDCSRSSLWLSALAWRLPDEETDLRRRRGPPIYLVYSLCGSNGKLNFEHLAKVEFAFWTGEAVSPHVHPSANAAYASSALSSFVA